MRGQLSLFDRIIPVARSTDPISSFAALERVDISAQRSLVLDALKRHPGATSKEIAYAEGIDRYMVARRLSDLAHLGLATKELDENRAPTKRACRYGGIACTWKAIENNT
jgi:DNA-binding MarR family transcriptional regulator